MKRFTRVTAILSMLALASGAQADLNRAGPANLPSPPGNGFPAWYQDLNGLTLDICLPNASDPGQAQQTACLLVGAGLPIPPYVFPTNFPDEVFYFRAVSVPLDTSPVPGDLTHKAILVLALEGAFATGGVVAGQQAVFTRIRVTAGLPHPGTWTVTHPYGIETFVVDTVSGARDIFFSEDVGIAPGAFTDALSSRVGPFLQASNVPGGPAKPLVAIPAGSQNFFLSDGLLPELLTGSPFGTNYFELCGPYDGASVTCRSTPSFSLTGRVHTGLIGSPLRVDRATYSRSGTTAQVDVSANAKAGVLQPAPKLTVAAATVSPVLLNGPTALGEWYGQGIPVPPDAIPSVLTVINSGDVPPTAVTAHVTDMVTVKSASYAGDTLAVVATSSDKGDALASPPTLSLDGFPLAAATLPGGAADPAEITFTVAGLSVPPPTVRVSSSVGGQGQADVIMQAAAPFAPGAPLAVDDNAVATTDDLFIDIPVLLNDVMSSAPLASPPVTIVTAPNIGTAVASASGIVTYTPSVVAGTATFTYTVSNLSGALGTPLASNVATVTVLVSAGANPIPVAVNDPSTGTLSVNTGGALLINVLANDSANGGTLNNASVVVTSQPVLGGGTATANASGTITYTAGATAGNFSFTYTVANTNGHVSNPATVSVTVTNPEILAVSAGSKCQNAGGQWTVSGTSTAVVGNTITLYRTAIAPGTLAQVIASVPVLANGRWSYNVKQGPACANPISIQSTFLTRVNNIAVQVR